MNKYHIVALPEDVSLTRINELRDFVYQNNFRFSNKPLKSDTHVTCAQLFEGRTEGSFLGLGDHLNLCNYTKIERADACWSYFKEKFPKSITFDKIAVLDDKGNQILVFELT